MEIKFMDKKQSTSFFKYFVVFLITLCVFITASYVSDFFTNKKVQNIKSVQDKIFLDLLSSETQFSLLQEIPCNTDSASIVSPEMNSLAEKVSSSEHTSSIDSEELASLKKYYSILEIKDYLLMKRISERCSSKNEFILYFYEDGNSTDTLKQEYALDALREKYPQLRVYLFDTKLDLSALRSMISIYKPEKDSTAWVVVNDKVYTGFKSVEDIEKIIPGLKTTAKKDTTANSATANSSEKTSSN
jgi:hypothetical protein